MNEKTLCGSVKRIEGHLVLLNQCFYKIRTQV
jgi:hypothetical protein